LDVYCLWDGAVFRLPNTAEGHSDLIARLGNGSGIRIGFEATGDGRFGRRWPGSGLMRGNCRLPGSNSSRHLVVQALKLTKLTPR